MMVDIYGLYAVSCTVVQMRPFMSPQKQVFNFTIGACLKRVYPNPKQQRLQDPLHLSECTPTWSLVLLDLLDSPIMPSSTSFARPPLLGKSTFGKFRKYPSENCPKFVGKPSFLSLVIPFLMMSLMMGTNHT